MAWLAPWEGGRPSPTNPDTSFVGWSDIAIMDLCRPDYWAALQPDRPAAADMPKVMKIEGRYSTLGAMMFVQHGLVVVQEPLRDLIEHIEPGVHGFWPLAIDRSKGGRKFQKLPCYLMRVQQARQSIVFEKSDVELHSEGGKDPATTTIPYLASNAHLDKYDLTISAAERGGAHLWCDFLGSFHYMLSDELHGAIADKKLKIWKTYRVAEIRC